MYSNGIKKTFFRADYDKVAEPSSFFAARMCERRPAQGIAKKLNFSRNTSCEFHSQSRDGRLARFVNGPLQS
jgi:hypothetical protein